MQVTLPTVYKEYPFWMGHLPVMYFPVLIVAIGTLRDKHLEQLKNAKV